MRAGELGFTEVQRQKDTQWKRVENKANSQAQKDGKFNLQRMIEKVLVGQIDGDRSTCRSIEMGRQVELYIGIHWNGKGIMNEAQRLGQTSFFL